MMDQDHKKNTCEEAAHLGEHARQDAQCSVSHKEDWQGTRVTCLAQQSNDISPATATSHMISPSVSTPPHPTPPRPAPPPPLSLSLVILFHGAQPEWPSTRDKQGVSAAAPPFSHAQKRNKSTTSKWLADTAAIKTVCTCLPPRAKTDSCQLQPQATTVPLPSGRLQLQPSGLFAPRA